MGQTFLSASRQECLLHHRWRWRNEVFRTYKRTLGKVKLTSRTIALLHREVEGSLLAVQIFLAHGALALSEGRDVEVMINSKLKAWIQSVLEAA